jgi:sec-independent protein translocase protein TatB
MLFDMGWSEILLIGAVALVVIGPKDLPKALRVAGYWVRKAREMSREFQSSVDQMIRDAELDEVRENLKKATDFDIEKEFHQTVDPTGSLAESLKPPELPDFSAPSAPAAEAGKQIEAPAPAEPAAEEDHKTEMPAPAEPATDGIAPLKP